MTAATLPLGGRLEGGLHRLPVRVYYEDTDAGGIVYHASYLRFAERGRTELLRGLGIDLSHWYAQEGLQFVLRSAEVKFRRPARLDDVLAVETAIKGVGAASLSLRQRVLDAAMTGELVSFDALLACVGRDGKPARLPAQVRNKIQALVSGFRSS